MYRCELCNFESSRLNDYKRHLETKKHATNINKTKISTVNTVQTIDNDDIVENNLNNPIQTISNQFTCDCGKKYKHYQTLWTHKQKCQNQSSDIKKIINELTDLKSKMDILTMQTQHSTPVIYNNDLSTNYTNNMINDNKIINNQKTINVVAYINEHYQNTEPLKLLDKPQLSKMLTCNPEKNGNHSICEFIVYYFDNHMLEELLADIVIHEFKKQNEEEQQFFATDVSRLTFIVRQALKSHIIETTEKEKCVWLTDKKGTSIVESIIVPLLSEVHTMLIEHIKKWDDEKNETYILPKIEKLGNRILSAKKITLNIVKGDYKEKTLQLISPYFQFQTTKSKNSYLIAY
jgi:hypothetical protein